MKRPIIIAVSLYITLTLIIVLLVPEYKDFAVVREKVGEANLELQYKRDYFSLLGNISEQLKQYEEQLSKIDSAIPSEMSALDMFHFINESSFRNGLILKEIGMNKVASSKTNYRIKENYINFTVSGSYPSFKSFISDLEKSARIIQIEGIVFRSSGVRLQGKEMPTSFSVAIKVNSY